jgi:predicted AAA+ superfamily ATPase
VCFDEIQNVPNWSSPIKELYDQDRPKGELSLVLLGSSALDLALQGEESLLGRYEIIRAPHWSFSEMQRALDWSLARYLQIGRISDPWRNYA